MAIVLVGMIDEREEALRLIMDTIEKRGHKTILIDISIGSGAIIPTIKPGISSEEIAKAGGTTIEKIKETLSSERDKATLSMADGLGKKLWELLHEGDLDGIIAVGGMTGTFIALSAMKLLPFGKPKLLISSVTAMPAYAKKLAEFFGVRDITVMHSVVDTVGNNFLVKNLMINGAGAICGMVEAYEPPQEDKKPSIAITEFNFCEKCAQYLRDILRNDFNFISFHATGVGEKAAVDLVSQGLFEAFIDLAPSGFSEYLLGGNRAAGEDRLDVGGNHGKPYILTPCGFDMISCGPIERKDNGDPLWVSRKLAERKLFLQDGMRVQARTSPQEMKSIAEAVAEKLNGHEHKQVVKFILPIKGFSSLSGEGSILYDPHSAQTFVEELKKNLDPDIEIIEVNTHINTREFARAIADVLNDTL